MSKLFGTNDTSIGKFQPLQKVARSTVMLSNATANSIGVNKMAPVWFWEVLMVEGISLPVVLGLLDERAR